VLLFDLQQPIEDREMKKPLGYIAYEGPSEIDGRPIVVIVNKLQGSDNAKTGADLVQTFILRADIAPTDALKTGDDVSICGQCIHRPILANESGEVPCYVNVGRSVRSVYAAYLRGRYQRASRAELRQILRGRKVRLGTYGDPAAAPVAMWQEITADAAGVVGYSHQWQSTGFDHAAWTPLVMASADTIDEAAQANLYGMRVFRVSVGVDKQAGEAMCPASAEAGKKATCDTCMLCGGTTKAARDIVIADHALGHKRRVIQMRAVA
jgi:hypothetical protein